MYLMFLTKCSGDVRVLSLLQRKYDSDGKMTSSIIRQKIIPLLQYKTPKIRPENSRAGLSYTVASIGFVTTKPERLMPKGALAPVTPNTQ
jgi:hypothetical protein